MNRFRMGFVVACSVFTMAAVAQVPTTQPEGPAMKMTGMNMPGASSAHDMVGTVSALDAKTGQVSVDANGMTLKLHFPPASLAGLKVGDKIQVSLSFKKL